MGSIDVQTSNVKNNLGPRWHHIGSYQVSEKWLKDRKGRELSSEEVTLYAKVVTTISETITIQKSLDDLFAEVEASQLEVKL